ncbi:RNA methyltransferase [Alphaproteobacteria bacterium]|nr:RNA methyltransferase [Alphaproteobacteria bacterium]
MLGKILNITSLQNPVIKNLTKIIRGNNQNEVNSFICEGEFFLKSAVDNNWEIQTLVINPNISFSSEIDNIINGCILKNVKVVSGDKKILSKLSNNKNAQNIIFTVKKKKFLFSDLNINDVHIAIDGIMDPGNLGTILRTISAFGINNIILIGDTVNQFKKEVVRSSMASLFNLKIINTNFINFKEWINKNSIRLYGTDLTSENNYLNENWIFPLCLVLGNEKNGISEEVKRLCCKLIVIKTKNNESLNLSVSNGIILSEIVRKYPI